MTERKSTFGAIGMTLGAVAFLLAIVHFWGGPFAEQPPIERTIAEKAVAIKDATVAALKGEERAQPQEARSVDIDQIVWLSTALLGGLAIILAVVGFARHESVRVAGGAAVLGGSAIAFQFAVLAIGMVFLAVLFASVLHHFEF